MSIIDCIATLSSRVFTLSFFIFSSPPHANVNNASTGSAIKVFKKFPFKLISGIEISEKLANTCLKNIKRLNDNRLNVFCQDARLFDHYDQYNIFYLYNPCTELILRPIIERLVSSSTNRKLLIYNNPKEETVLIENGFTYLKTYKDEWGNGIKIFEYNC